MLSPETEQKLVQIFITISVGEEKINKLKQDILENFNINPIQFFFKFDIDNKNYISKKDISNYLNSFSIKYTPIDIDFIFYFYDKDFDKALNFNEFIDLIISDSNYIYKKTFKKKYINNNIDQNDLNNNIDINIQKSILQIFIEEIELSKQLNDLILDIKQCKDFIIQDIFYEIKSYSYITNESLEAFFDRNEVNYNEKFIKNIFNRFDKKEINGRISFTKFKNFFDLPYTKNMNEKQDINLYINISNNNNNFNKNEFPKIINQSEISEDINLNNLIKLRQNYNYNYNYNNEEDYNNLNNNEKTIFLNNNVKYINEDDIQFKCSHLSRSGSNESIKNKNNNCGYVSKNSKNNSYKNYLREKRSKSLEKSLSRSLSKSNEAYTNQLYQKINENNKNNNNNNRVIEEKNNYSINERINSINSKTLNNEDIPIKLPERLDKKLVKRKLPEKVNKRQLQNKNIYNFCYENHPGKCNHSFFNHNCGQYINNYYNENIQNKNNVQKQKYNHEIDDIISSKDLNFNTYEIDFGNKKINNGRYK